VLDEPTNHLDAEARAFLVAALRRFAGVGVLVSHDRELLDALCAETVRVAHGGARSSRRLRPPCELARRGRELRAPLGCAPGDRARAAHRRAAPSRRTRRRACAPA
jgi:ATPase subunit of ABC transporter with duplicated ATPase domains